MASLCAVQQGSAPDAYVPANTSSDCLVCAAGLGRSDPGHRSARCMAIQSAPFASAESRRSLFGSLVRSMRADSNVSEGYRCSIRGARCRKVDARKCRMVGTARPRSSGDPSGIRTGLRIRYQEAHLDAEQCRLLGQLLELVKQLTHSVLPRIDAGLPGSFNSVPVLVTVSPSTRSTEMSSSMKLPT